MQPTLGKEIHKPVKFYVVMEIRQELHLPSGYYHPFKEKEDNKQRAL